MWIDEKNRRSYKIPKEAWKACHRIVISKYKDKEVPKKYEEIAMISEAGTSIFFLHIKVFELTNWE